MLKPTRPPRRTNEERSRETRTRLLEATVACLYEFGYAATTGKLAIERAGLSRGAALHHFPSRVDLILETALYIVHVQNEYRGALREPGLDPKAQLLATLDIVWASWSRPHAIALLEIMIGSRSDPELAERFPEIKRQIEKTQRDRFWEMAQEAGITNRRMVDTAVVLSVSVMRGLAVERMLSDDKFLIQDAFEMFKAARTNILLSMMDTMVLADPA